jgi:hypothetical protein
MTASELLFVSADDRQTTAPDALGMTTKRIES